MKERLLLLAPTPRDAELGRAILAEAGLNALVCRDFEELCREMAAGAGAILLTDVSLNKDDPERLAGALRQQPAWSDIPIILLSPLGADSPAAVWAMEMLGNVTVLDQPVRVMTLVSTLRTAVKARQRQYELRDRLDALHQADRQKDEFLATLSHELRNPLAPIRNALHVLRLAGDDPQTRARVLDTMERQTGHVIRLVDDLLELSRINEGRIVLRKERVKLTSVLRSALESSAPIVEAAGHELVVTEPPAELLLHADPVRLIQVIANLLNNAAKYTDRGGRIVISAQAEGSEAVIRVRDTGVGIPADMLDRIFDMFVQVELPPDRTRQGLGIGLTLVKRLVELHGGTVVAHSEGPGLGSEFIVRLPAFADQRVPPVHRQRGGVAAPAAGTERRKSDLPRFRILVVDDHHDAGESLATLLRLLGHQVRVAYDGMAGLEAARVFRPQVALLDIGMPGIDGIELGKHLRREPELDDMLMIALTGYGRDEDRRRSSEAGFNAHLVKPVDIAALNGMIAKHALRLEAQFA
ncbi:MAG: hybrid sensor histidine kinase/response regulator [Gemmatimonadetes bacterium]|nr:MAG: hybrid sensor histidine kinase/response regulator [Gemmatimonadota bacterium]